MNRQQLEHVILEVGRRTGEEYFYIIGSAAVLAVLPDAMDAALVGTRDVDVLPAPVDVSRAQTLADQLDWVVGEGSDFDVEYGYYIQGVTRDTPTYAPEGWEMRTIPLRVGEYTGLCMEVHDLALAKYGAGREKDLQFTGALAQTGILDQSMLLERLEGIKADRRLLALVRDRIERDFKQ